MSIGNMVRSITRSGWQRKEHAAPKATTMAEYVYKDIELYC